MFIVQAEPTATSPNPTIRKSLEEKEPAIKQQIIPAKPKQTSPVAQIGKIARFGATGNSDDSNVMVHKTEVVSTANGNSAGNKFLMKD